MMEKLNETINTTNILAGKYYERYNNGSILEKQREKFMDALSGNRILDVGCGTGRDCREFKNKGYHLVGVDLSDGMLKFAKTESDSLFIKSNMIEMPFLENSFDGIWISSSLYHVSKEEAKKVLKDCYKFLKNEGMLFLTIKMGNKEGMMKREYFGELKKFYAYYTPEEIETTLKDIGFSILDIEVEKKDQNWINVFVRKEKQRDFQKE